MTASAANPSASRPIELPCYKRVGIWGDRSCEDLKTHAHCHHCPVFSQHADQLLDRPMPRDYAQQWTDRLSQPVQRTQAAARHSLLVFRVQQEWLGMDVAIIKQIAPAGVVHAVPHRSGGQIPGFLGLINVRGSLELAISLQALLGIADASHAAGRTSSQRQPRLLVVEHQQQRWVFPVDQADGVHHVPSDQLTDPPATVQRAGGSLTRHVVHLKDFSVGCLDTDKLLATLNRMFQA